MYDRGANLIVLGQGTRVPKSYTNSWKPLKSTVTDINIWQKLLGIKSIKTNIKNGEQKSIERIQGVSEITSGN